MSRLQESHVVETVEQERSVSRVAICTQCRIDMVLLDALIEHGVVEMDAQAELCEIHVLRVTRAVRVMHEFDVGIDNLALVVDLLDKLQIQQREMEQLRKLVVRN